MIRRIPTSKSQAMPKMGWDMPWYTITDSFDVDFSLDQWHGHNVFFRDGDRVFRTYFITSRGDEAIGSTWSYLDATPLGRQETWEDSPLTSEIGTLRRADEHQECLLIELVTRAEQA